MKNKPKDYASLVFLDPFGMQINWDSIAQLSGTRTDIWILVPTGVIVNRLLNKNGDLKHSVKLQSFFGLSEDEIRDYFYKEQKLNTLFGEEKLVTKISKPIEKISELYIKQLKTIWSEVTEKPLRLENNRGVPIFHFVFASNNKVAVKIAKEIITSV
jgi:three-Cys-motif partner protein